MPVDTSWGYVTSLSSAWLTGKKWVTKLTLAFDANIVLCGARCGISSASNGRLFYLVIYEDSGGVPGDLFFVSNPLTFVSGDFAVGAVQDPTPAIPAGTYHVGLFRPDSANGVLMRLLSATGDNNSSPDDADGPTDPFGTPDDPAPTSQLSFYVYLISEDLNLSKGVGYAVLYPPGAPVSKSLAYAVLSTETTVSVSKAVAYAVIVEGVEGGVQPVVFIIT